MDDVVRVQVGDTVKKLVCVQTHEVEINRLGAQCRQCAFITVLHEDK